MNLAPSIAIITALPKEHAAVQRLLSNSETLNIQDDTTLYTIGNMRCYNGAMDVVLACLTKYANNPSAITTTNLLRSFPSVTDVIIVGIAAGIPRPEKPNIHVRLGDIVVSSGAGIVQFDLGVQRPTNFEIRDTSAPPSARLLQAVNQLESETLIGKFDWISHLNSFLSSSNIKRPSKEAGKQFRHPTDRQRTKGIPKIHRGKIGASNTLLKSSSHRDKVANSLGLLAIEMEGSGLADATWEVKAGYLVIKSTCDYGDENKNDAWQEYAAHVAAAYLGAVFLQIPCSKDRNTRSAAIESSAQKKKNESINNVTRTGAYRLNISEQRLTCCLWPLDGDSVCTAGFAGIVYFLSTKQNDKGIEQVSCGSSIIRCMCRTNDVDKFLIGDDIGRILLVDRKNLAANELARTDSSLFSINILPNLNIAYSSERNGSVIEWKYNHETSAFKRLRVIHRHDGPSFQVAFDISSNICASVGADGYLIVTELDSGNTNKQQVSDNGLFCLSMSPRKILIGDSSGKLWVWAINGGAISLYEGHTDAIRSVQFSNQYKWCLTSSKDETLRLWNINTNRNWIIDSSNDYYYQAEFSACGKKIVACDGGGDLIVLSLILEIDEYSAVEMDKLLRGS